MLKTLIKSIKGSQNPKKAASGHSMPYTPCLATNSLLASASSVPSLVSGDTSKQKWVAAIFRLLGGSFQVALGGAQLNLACGRALSKEIGLRNWPACLIVAGFGLSQRTIWSNIWKWHTQKTDRAGMRALLKWILFCRVSIFKTAPPLVMTSHHSQSSRGSIPSYDKQIETKDQL